MGHGGYRPGAGRPKSGVARAAPAVPRRKLDTPAEIADAAAEEGLTPLEFMLQVMRDEAEDMNMRSRMAVAAAPFVHARAGEAKAGKKELRKDAASKASTGKFSGGAPPRLVVRNS